MVITSLDVVLALTRRRREQMGQGAERIYTVLSEASKKGQVFGNPFHSLSFTRERSERKYEPKESTHTAQENLPARKNKKNQTKSLAFVSSDLLLWRWLESCAGLQLGLDLPSNDYLFELLLESWHLYRGHPSRPVQKVPAKNRISRNKSERKAQGDIRRTPPAFSLIPNNVNTALSRLTVAWCGL